MIPRKELEEKLKTALRMLLKIANNKETWTLDEVRRTIKAIANGESNASA